MMHDVEGLPIAVAQTLTFELHKTRLSRLKTNTVSAYN